MKLWLSISLALLLASASVSAQEVASPPAAGAQAADAALSDTILMKQVAPETGWFDRVTGIASGLMTLALLVLTAALVPAAWNFRKNHKMIRRFIEKIEGDVAPIVKHAAAIADDVNYVTTSIRADVQKVNQTIALANRKVVDAMEAAERRLNELNALLDVAQEEVESAFISTAATLHGISTGAAALGKGNGRRRQRAREQELRERMDELRAAIDDDDLESAVDDVGPALEDSFAEEEATDGNNGRGAADGWDEASPGGREKGYGPGSGTRSEA